jgi:hypothetical protein
MYTGDQIYFGDLTPYLTYALQEKELPMPYDVQI